MNSYAVFALILLMAIAIFYGLDQGGIVCAHVAIRSPRLSWSAQLPERFDSPAALIVSSPGGRSSQRFSLIPLSSGPFPRVVASSKPVHLVLAGPLLGEADSRGTKVRFECRGDGIALRIEVKRSAFGGSLEQNPIGRPLLDFDLTSDLPDVQLESTWQTRNDALGVESPWGSEQVLLHQP